MTLVGAIARCLRAGWCAPGCWGVAALWVASWAAAANPPVALEERSLAAPPARQPAPGTAPKATPVNSVADKLPAARLSKPKNFVYRAEGKRLSEVLQDFAASQSMPGIVAEGVDGVVNANFDGRPEVFLETMVRAYGLLWYSDGLALYFYPARALQSRLFRLKGFRRQQVTGLLQSLELGDRRYPLKFDEPNNTLLVSGPPRHVELVSAAVEALGAGAQERNTREMRMFPLRFAAAADRQLGDVLIPGVASMLRALHGGSAQRPPGGDLVGTLLARESVFKRESPASMPRAPTGQYLPSWTQLNADSGDRRQPLGVQGKDAEPEREESAPQFQADESTNSVIVLAPQQRMADFETLIQQMDLMPVQVELEASIIEVNSESADALGVNWSMRSGGNSLSINGPVGDSPAAMPAFTLGTVISNAGRELLARVSALQAEGQARILSKPSVLGAANRTALLSEKRVATVRVAGNLEAKVFQVEAGTRLQMTPQVIQVEGVNRIKLTIYIEDGNFEQNNVDQVPIVKKTEIRTEAHVLEGESLLIGGITVESDLRSNNSVPGLGSVPFLGALFRSREGRVTRNERLFLITPRVLNSGGIAPSQPMSR